MEVRQVTCLTRTDDVNGFTLSETDQDNFHPTPEGRVMDSTQTSTAARQMSDPQIFALGRCFTCDKGFDFDPETVTTVLIDPVTNRPPDVGPDEQPIHPDPIAVDRAVQKMICPDCVITIRAAGNRFI